MKLPKNQNLKGHGQVPFSGWGRPNPKPKIKKTINRPNVEGFKL